MEQIVEIIVLLVAPWPLWRLLAFPNTWRSVPGKAALLAAALVAYAVIAIGVGFLAPALLRLLAVLALAALLYDRWRARVGYGGRRDLPPGSLGLLPLAPCRDDRFYSVQTQTHGPVFKTSATYPYPSPRPMVCVAGQAQARSLFRDHAEALEVAPAARFNRLIPHGFLRYMASDDHMRYRRVIQAALSPAVVQQTDAQIAARVQEACQTMAAACQSNGTRGAAPRGPINDLLFVLFLELFFEIGKDHAAFDRLRSLLPRIGIRARLWPSSTRRDEAVLTEISTILRDQAKKLRDESKGDGAEPASFLAALLRAEPEAIGDDTVLRNIIFMVETGRHDLGGLLLWILKLLGDNPLWLARLRAELDQGDQTPEDTSGSLADRIVKETLRLEQSEYLFRCITRDIRFGGFRLPKGWVLRVCVREGHGDAAVFERPEVFDPDRFLAPTFSASQYAPFGLDQHRCMGVPLIEAVSRHFVTALARDFDWSVAKDGPRYFGRFHWEPNRDFRISITTRPDGSASARAEQPAAIARS